MLKKSAKRKKKRKRSKEEHEKKVAALEREKELARIQAEKDRIEAEAAAKRAEEKAKRKEQEYLARIVDIEETINVLAKGKRSLFWSKSILDLSTEIQELPTKYRASISNIDKLDNLIKEANKIREEFDVTNEYNRLVDQEKKTKTWLQDVEKARNKLLAIAPKYAISEVEIDDLYKKAIKLTLESEIFQLKKYINDDTSKSQVEKYKSIETLYNENSKYIDFYDNKIGPSLTRYWKELEPYRKEIKAEKEREKELKRQKAEEKRKKQEKERHKVEIAERNKRIRQGLIDISPIIIFVLTVLLVVGGHFLIKYVLPSIIADYEQYILGGIALVGTFLSFFFTQFYEQEGVISIIALVGFGFLAFFPGFQLVGIAGLTGEFIGKLTLFRYGSYRQIDLTYVTSNNKVVVMNQLLFPLVLLIALISVCINYMPDPFKYGPILMLVTGYIVYVQRIIRLQQEPVYYILGVLIILLYLAATAAAVTLTVFADGGDTLALSMRYNVIVIGVASALALTYLWIPADGDEESLALAYVGPALCSFVSSLILVFYNIGAIFGW